MSASGQSEGGEFLTTSGSGGEAGGETSASGSGAGGYTESGRSGYSAYEESEEGSIRGFPLDEDEPVDFRPLFGEGYTTTT